jgi:tripartite-type tricarboxylate transporter receptor subunit TctC
MAGGLSRKEFLRRTGLLGAGLALAPTFLHAQSVESFYGGRKITLIVPTSRGGINDLAGRLVARHLGRFVPGAPVVEVQNQVEGGGIALANRFADTQEKDGATIAILQRGIAQLAIQGESFARFDPLKLTWLGSLSSFSSDAYILVVNRSHPAQTWRDLKRPAVPALIGGDAPGSTNLTFALAARDVLGLNIQVKDGFSGAAGMFLAMANGDLDGQVIGLNSIMANQAALWNAGGVKVLLQFGRTARHPLLPDVPLASELTRDRDARAILAFTEAPLAMALPFLAPAGVPGARADALGTAFMAMVKDRDFLADAERSKLDITPIDGAAVRRVIAAMAATPRDTIARYNRMTRL